MFIRLIIFNHKRSLKELISLAPFVTFVVQIIISLSK